MCRMGTELKGKNDNTAKGFRVISIVSDKVWMYEEIMTNDDNLESNLLTSSLL